MPRWPSLKERFEAAVSPEPNSGCWLWTGWGIRHGYGCIGVEKGRRLATHVSLELVGRSVPKGKSVCHTCDNPYCVNPEHLFIGTQKDNVQDALRKGRLVKPPLKKRRQFCPRGHPLADPNLYYKRNGKRQCRECTLINGSLRWAKRCVQHTVAS